MTYVIGSINPIQGLLDYIQDIKPYHSKIVDVLTEYVHEETVQVTISDSIAMNIEFNLPSEAQDIIDASIASFTSSTTIEGFGGDMPYGVPDPGAWPIITYDIRGSGPFDSVYTGYDETQNTVTITGDRTEIYVPGRQIELVIYDSSTTEFVVLDTYTYTILSSEYELPLTEFETPHTLLSLSSLPSIASIKAANANIDTNNIYVTISLTPFDVGSVITGFGGVSPIEYTDVPSDNTTPPLPLVATQVLNSQPTESMFSGTWINSFVIDNTDVTSIFTTGTVLEFTGTGDTYTVLYSIVDGSNTVIRVIEQIPDNIDITSAAIKIKESIPGYDSIFNNPTQSTGVLSAFIVDTFSISWSDPGSSDVIGGYQYPIQATSGKDVVVNGQRVDTVVSTGDQVQILGNNDINGIYTVASASSTSITLSTALTSSQGGFIEKYVP